MVRCANVHPTELAAHRAREAERKRMSRENKLAAAEMKGTPKLEHFFKKKA